jgi:hypothetical protein
VKISYSAVSVKALRNPRVADYLRKQFKVALRGEPTSYNWRLIPEGDVWYQFGGENVYADENMVEIGAMR